MQLKAKLANTLRAPSFEQTGWVLWEKACKKSKYEGLFLSGKLKLRYIEETYILLTGENICLWMFTHLNW